MKDPERLEITAFPDDSLLLQFEPSDVDDCNSLWLVMGYFEHFSFSLLTIPICWVLYMQMDINIMFSRTQLKQIRQEAKALKINVPKNLTALRAGVGTWFLVEGDGFRKEFTADNAFDAKYKAIYWLMKQEGKV